MLYKIKKICLMFFVVAFVLLSADISATTISSSINDTNNLKWNMGEPDFHVHKTNLQLDTKNNKTALVLSFDEGIIVNSYPDENTPALKEYLEKVTKKTVAGRVILEFEFKNNVTTTMTIEVGIRLDHGTLDLEDNIIIQSALLENDIIQDNSNVNINTFSHLTPKLTFSNSSVTPGQEFNYTISHSYAIKENTSVANTGAYTVSNTYTEIYVPKGITVVNPTADKYLDNSDPENPKIVYKNWDLYEKLNNTIILKVDNTLDVNQTLSSAQKSCFSATYSKKSNRTFCVDSPKFKIVEEKNLDGTIPLYNGGIDSKQELLTSFTLENTKPYDLTNLKVDLIIPDGFRPTSFSFGDNKYLNITFPIIVEYRTNLNSQIEKVTIVSNGSFFSSDKLNLSEDEYLTSISICFPMFKQSDYLKAGFSPKDGFKLFGDIGATYKNGEEIKDNDEFTWISKITADEMIEPTTIRAVKKFKREKISQVSMNVTVTPNKNIYYAGDSYNLSFAFGIGRYNGSTRIVNPEFYLRIPDFLIYDIESLTSTLHKQGLYPEITTYLDNENNNIIKLSFHGSQGDKTYFNKNAIDLNGDEIACETTLIKMELMATISPLASPTTINLIDDFKLLSVNLDKVTDNQVLNLYEGLSVVDTNGIVDNNSNNNLGIVKSTNIGLNVFRLEDAKTFKAYALTKSTSDSQWLAYNGNESTISKYYAAKQDTGIYKLIIKNNLGQAYNDYVTYVPIPKINDANKSKWSMSLAGAPKIVSNDVEGIKMSYTEATNPDIYELIGGADDGYLDNLLNYENVTMIKIKIDELKDSSYYEIDIPMKINDKESNNSYNEVIYFNAHYSAELNGVRTPTYQVSCLAAKLIPTSINGVVFEDVNYNSKNDDNKFFENATVELYDVNDSDNVLASVNTKVDGSYEFQTPTFKETSDFSGKYVVKFIKPKGYTAALKKVDTANDTSFADENTQLSDKLNMVDDHQDINAGFGKDAKISVTPLEHNDVKIGSKYTRASTYSINNGIFYDCNIIDSKVFSYEVKGNNISFTAIKSGNTFATLRFKDGYGRIREDLNKTIALNSIYTKSNFFGKVKFLNNEGKITNVPSKYIEKYNVKLKKNSKDIATTYTNEKGEYSFNDLELLDDDYKIEIVKPVASNLDYVEVTEKKEIAKSSNYFVISNHTQGDTKEINFYISDLICPDVNIETKNDLFGYNPTKFVVDFTENETYAQLIYHIERDGKEFKKGESDSTLEMPFVSGKYVITYYAQDLANNKSKSKKISFTIDKIAPNVRVKVNKKYNPTINDIEINITDNIDDKPKIYWGIATKK